MVSSVLPAYSAETAEPPQNRHTLTTYNHILVFTCGIYFHITHHNTRLILSIIQLCVMLPQGQTLWNGFQTVLTSNVSILKQ